MSAQNSQDEVDFVASIRLWQGIEPPHPSAVEFSKDVQGLIKGFRALPAPDFQSEPADFVRVLDALGE